MNWRKTRMALDGIRAGMVSAENPPDANDRAVPPPAAGEQQRRVRLERLFRNFGDSPADRYFRSLVTRYRMGGPP